jgi:hypothetical protein
MKNKWAVMLISMAAVLAMPLAHAEGEVARAIITTAVVDREPVNDLEVIPASESTVVFFTDLRGMEGQTIKHVWMHGNEQIADVSFEVRGPRWRIWSSKKMIPEWNGNWTVQVVNGAGDVLAEKSFTYGMDEGSGMETAPEEGQAPKAEEMPMTEQAPVTEEAPMTEEAPAPEKKSGSGMAE